MTTVTERPIRPRKTTADNNTTREGIYKGFVVLWKEGNKVRVRKG
jgi:hypothetical protein